jgi:hypothetical protein
MIDLSDHVRVTNETGRVIYGRYDGVDYVFPPRKHVDVHVNVARHVFGFDLEDKSHALSRLGWMTTSDQLEEAYAELAKIKFNPVPAIPGTDEYDEETGPSSQDRAPRSRKGSAPELAPSPLPMGSASDRERLSLRKPPQEDDGRL